MCHARQLLVTQGTESFKETFSKIFNLEKKDPKKIGFVKQCKETSEYKAIKEYVESALLMKNHPKLQKLAEILSAFFSDPKHTEASKVIVFTQYRESAKEIKRFLDENIKPVGLVRSDTFLGQQEEITQKIQAARVLQFKNGTLNVLVATSVAEEGLDIGDVNLIVSYDCLASPIRMVQRLGRTGRAGEGKVIILIAKGDEENKIK